MVKITIKKPLPDQIRSESEETEGDSEASEAESSGSRNSNNLTKSGKPKRKCVLELQKSKSSKSAKPRSKSVSPEEEYYETRTPKKLFTCDTCSKAFHSNFVLKVHLKAHKKIENSKGQCDKYYHYYYNTVN